MLVYENQPSKLFWYQEFFPYIFISKMRVKITNSIITKNHLADRKGFYVGVRQFMKK